MNQTLQPQVERMLLSPEEVGVALSVSRVRVYELMRSNGLPYVKLGAGRRTPVAALEKWVAEQAELAMRRQGATAGSALESDDGVAAT